MLMVILLGLTCISSLSGQGKRALLLGLMSAGFGFICSLIGQDRQAGILRFTFGQLYLWNGLPLVPVMVRVLVPGFALRLVWMVRVELPVVLAGLKTAVAFAGRPLTVRATVPVKPPLRVIVIV